MKLGIATTREEASQAQWVDFDMKGFEKNLTDPPQERIAFLIVPQTRSLITALDRRAELKSKARGRDYSEGTELPESGNDKGDRFTKEMAKELVRDWRNVANKNGEPLECNDTNKIWLFENIDIALWVLDAAKDLSADRLEKEQKN